MAAAVQDSVIVKAFETLVQLVIQGDYDLVRQLATSELAKAKDERGRTVIILAADMNDSPVQLVKCMEYLMHLGADPMATDALGDTAAHLAARRDHLRLLAMLPFDAKWQKNDRSGFTPLMEAVKCGSWKSVKHLIHLLRQWRYSKKKNARRLELLGMESFKNQTALDSAKEVGQLEMASVIEREMRLEYDKIGGITGLTESEEEERKSLEKLAMAGDFAGLLAAATRVNCDLPDKWGVTPLWFAAGNSHKCGDPAALQQLLAAEVGDPTCASVRGLNCLHSAAEKGQADAVRQFAALGGAYVNDTGGDSKTPLMWAAELVASEAAEATLGALLAVGANWEMEDLCNQTAINVARCELRSDVVALLLRYETLPFFDMPMDLPPGYTQMPPFLEKWDTVRLLGSGAFGDVHEVLTDRGIRCAAKTIRLPVQLGDQTDKTDREIKRLVESERNLCQLLHPNIVRFLHITEKDANVVVFMELLEGISLENEIGGQAMKEETISKFSTQICSALTYMHSVKPPVIHWDINCSNIIVLTGGNRVKLIDFGLSLKLMCFTCHTGTTDDPKGSINFMAPELFGSDSQDICLYSRESDIWAFGCTVYQMATGTRPHSEWQNSCEFPDLLQKTGAPALPDGSSQQLKNFYSCCVALDRKERKSAAELLSHEFLSPQTEDSLF